MPVAFSPEALADLAAIRAYIGDRNPAAASRVAIQLVAACVRLEHLTMLPQRWRLIQSTASGTKVDGRRCSPSMISCFSFAASTTSS